MSENYRNLAGKTESFSSNFYHYLCRKSFFLMFVLSRGLITEIRWFARGITFMIPMTSYMIPPWYFGYHDFGKISMIPSWYLRYHDTFFSININCNYNFSAKFMCQYLMIPSALKVIWVSMPERVNWIMYKLSIRLPNWKFFIIILKFS